MDLTRAAAAVLSPAARLFGRLRYAQKFTVVGLVLLVPLALVAGAYVALQQDQIAFSARERTGVVLMRPLIDLTALLVRERYDITTGTGGTNDLTGRLAELDALDRRFGERLRVTTHWAHTRDLVLATRTDGQDRTDAYDDAVESVLALIVRVGDESNLTLDPNVASTYLVDTLQFRLPVLLDAAGRAAEAAARPDRPNIDPRLVLGLNHGLISDLRRTLSRAAEAVVGRAVDPVVRAGARAGFAGLDMATGRLDAALSLATTAGHLDSVAEPAVQVHREAVEFASWVADGLDRVLAARISGYTDRAWRVGIGSSAAALLALYLFAAFYLSVSRPIRRIVDVLDAVAHGDLTRRTPVDTRDELGFVSRALNDTIARTEVATERLATRATHDPLTRLPNRDLVLRRLTEALDRTARTGEPMCVLFVDLDRFKMVNDSLGHGAGDEVLRTVATRLTELNRAGDLVGRLAGDEFVVVCEQVPSVDVARRIAERIVERVNEPIVVRAGSGPSAGTHREVGVGASVGLALADGSTRPDPADLLRDADVAMYHAKQRGRGRVEIFDDRLRLAVENRLELCDQLRRAVEAGEILVHYQPIVSVADEGLLAFEALARWEHPTRGLLTAAEFIPAATESGLILPLGDAVLRRACHQAAAWRTVRPDLRITVNVCGTQLADGAFVDTVAEALTDSGLEPDALWLELTETGLMADVAAARRTLDGIRALGAHVAVDDFGTGYSSLAYLRQFPVEMVKIDRSFIGGLDDGADGAASAAEAIITMVVALARTLDLRVVAEGVETREQLARLAELGCDVAQGHLFGTPAPAEEAGAGVRAGVRSDLVVATL